MVRISFSSISLKFEWREGHVIVGHHLLKFPSIPWLEDWWELLWQASPPWKKKVLLSVCQQSYELTTHPFWLWCCSLLSSLSVGTEGSLVFKSFLPWVWCALCCSGLKQARGREQQINNRLRTTSVWKTLIHLKEKKIGKGRWVLIWGHWAWAGKEQFILPTSTLEFPGVKEGWFLRLGGVFCLFDLGFFFRQQSYIAFGS